MTRVRRTRRTEPPRRRTRARQVLPPRTLHGTLCRPPLLQSGALGQRRRIAVYLPPNFSALPLDSRAPRRAPVLYLHDGEDYIRIAALHRRVDALIAAGELPPLALVFVEPADRYLEYDRNRYYLRFFTEELVPWVEERYRIGGVAEMRGTMGASLGGYVSVIAAAQRPGLFGRCASQSGAFDGDRLRTALTEVAHRKRTEQRFHFLMGSYDRGPFQRGQSDVADALRRGGAGVQERRFNEGHSWGLWRVQALDAIRYLFGRSGP